MIETKEWYFFKWAYPCMYVLLQNSTITKETLNKLDKMYAEGIAPSKEELEIINSAAFRRMKIVAKKLNKNLWDWEVLKSYWEKNKHNEVIDKREGNYSKFNEDFCNMCKVNSGKVISIEKKSEGIILELETSNGKRKFVQGKFLEAKKDDIILTHLAYAVQKA